MCTDQPGRARQAATWSITACPRKPAPSPPQRQRAKGKGRVFTSRHHTLPHEHALRTLSRARDLESLAFAAHPLSLALFLPFLFLVGTRDAGLFSLLSQRAHRIQQSAARERVSQYPRCSRGVKNLPKKKRAHFNFNTGVPRKAPHSEKIYKQQALRGLEPGAVWWRESHNARDPQH